MKHRRFLDAAYTAALASPGTRGNRSSFRLGAIIVAKKRILAAKYNSLKTHPKLARFYQYAYLHAESCAILSLGLANCSGTNMYVVRIKRDNSRALAKPCDECMKLIRYVGIKKVIYSIEEGFAECSI